MPRKNVSSASSEPRATVPAISPRFSRPSPNRSMGWSDLYLGWKSMSGKMWKCGSAECEVRALAAIAIGIEVDMVDVDRTGLAQELRRTLGVELAVARLDADQERVVGDVVEPLVAE